MWVANMWSIIIKRWKYKFWTITIMCIGKMSSEIFLRFAIGLNMTPLIGLYGETSTYPIAIEMLCNSIKYLNRLTDTEENPLLHQCLLENIKF